MWNQVAPRLAEDFTVVAADLRGYGESSKPPTTDDHEPYSKRAMARDQIEVMGQLGFERFSVAGHDRGGRCAYRLALDHPELVERLAVLDIVPTGDTSGASSARKCPQSIARPRTSSAHARQVSSTSNHRPSSSRPDQRTSTGHWIRTSPRSASSSSWSYVAPAR
jgi:pimeloyl-ACP methyl ester carboxylesterase